MVAPTGVVAVEIVEDRAPSPVIWEAAATWFGGALLAAASRGEFVVLERGAWELIQTPYAFACTRREGDRWQIMVEAQPAPRADSWPYADPGKLGATR